MQARLKLYCFHWLNGKVEEAYGFNLGHAFRTLGYGPKAAFDLERWGEVKENKQVQQGDSHAPRSRRRRSGSKSKTKK